MHVSVDQTLLVMSVVLVGLGGLVRGVTVRTKVGDIVGTELKSKDKSLHRFLGIPFAEPPVGTQRFQPPVPKEPFTEPFKADKIGYSCLQNEEWLKKIFELSITPEDPEFTLDDVKMDEDCLNLNIWVPTGGEEKKAVMIWIHGGGFILGAGAQYNASKLALFGDVIVVTINYRLGIFGFFSTTDEHATGNYALLDQHLAFKWVQENIGAFGGDTDRVTIFGESAGSASVTWHMLAPSNEGLFHRVIAESGTSLATWTLPDQRVAKKYSRILAKHLNCSNDNVELLVVCLQAAPAEAFQYMGSSYPFLEELGGRVPAGVRADGIFIPYLPTATSPKERMQDQPFFRSVDFMIGANMHEGSPFVHMVFEGMYKAQTNQSLYDSGVSRQFFETAWKMFGGKHHQGLLDAFWWRYSTSINGNTKDNMPAEEFLEFLGDFMMYYGTYKHLKNRVAESSEATGSTYQYSFIYPASSAVGTLADYMGREPFVKKAMHGDEVGFLFPKPAMMRGDEIYPKEELELSDAMVTYWTNFAKSGNPNEPVPVLKQWPQFKAGEEEFIEFDIVDKKVDLRINTFYRSKYMTFWDDVISLITNPLVDESDTTGEGEAEKERDSKPRKDEL